MFSNPPVLAISGCFLSVFLLAGCTNPIREQEQEKSLTPHPIFERTEAELKKSAAIVSYVGDHTKPIPAVAFTTKDFDSSLDVLNPVRGVVITFEPGAYAGRFVVTTAEIRKMLLALKPIAGGAIVMQQPALVSFAVASDHDGELESYEFKVPSKAAVDFYEKLIGALDPENQVGRTRITEQFHRAVPSAIIDCCATNASQGSHA